jgi:hypothetical protein
MKKALAVSLMLLVSNSFAYYEDPKAYFNATKNMTNTTTITWKQVDDVQGTCEAESRRRGNGGFGFTVEACSFWSPDKTSCTIVTGKQTNLHQLGHETRHCFQGAFH